MRIIGVNELNYEMDWMGSGGYENNEKVIRYGPNARQLTFTPY